MFREIFPGRKKAGGVVSETRAEEPVVEAPKNTLLSELERGRMTDSEKAFRIAVSWEFLNETEKGEVGDYFGALKDLDVKLFQQLVESGAEELVAKNPQAFTLSEYNIALLLTDSRAGRSFFNTNPSFGDFDKSEIARSLAEWGEFGAFRLSKEFFSDVDLSEVGSNLIKEGNGKFVSENLDIFSLSDHSPLALDMLGSQFTGLRTFYRHVHEFRNLNNDVIDRILEILRLQHTFSHGLQEFVFNNLPSFSPDALEHLGEALPMLPTDAREPIFRNLERLPVAVADTFVERILPLNDSALSDFLSESGPATLRKYEAIIVEDALTHPDTVVVLCKNIGRFSTQWHARIYEQVLKEKVGGLGAYLGKFQGIDTSVYANQFKNSLYETDLLVHLHTFPSLDTLEYVESLYATKPELLTKYFDQFKNFDKNEFIQKHFTDANFSDLARDIQTLEGLNRQNAREVVEILEVMDFEKAARLNLTGNPPHIPELARFAEIMGERSNGELFQVFASHEYNEASFLNTMKQVETGLLASDTSVLERIIEDPNLSSFAMATVRYKSSQWGQHDSESFRASLSRYLENKNTYQPLPGGYVPGTIEVQKQRKLETNEYVYSPEFRERWQALVPSLVEAREIAAAPEKLVGLYTRFTSALEAERQEVIDALGRAPNEHARANLERRLSELSSVSLNSIPEMAEAFETLFDRKKRPELTELFRLYGFYGAIYNSPAVPRDYSKEAPSREEISEVLELVQHVTHQETWEKNEYFASEGAQKALAALFHTKALEDELVRMARSSEGKTSGTMQALTVLPSRDLLTEFSGHIGDACWASRYDILKEYPNISSLTFRKGEALAGAALLIDTMTGDGVPLTVIRGLNPQETIINKLDAASFIGAIRDYLGPIAQERGRKLAIVIDDHSGGSATNRPLLYAYLSGLRNSLTKVQRLSEQDTTFNGYDITPHTYLLP